MSGKGTIKFVKFIRFIKMESLMVEKRNLV